MRLVPRLSGFWTRVRRHPGRAAAVVGVVCLAAGVGAFFLVQQARARDHWRRAEQAVADREFEQAQAHLTAYLERKPDSAEAHFRLARAYRRARREDFDRAAHHLAEARRLGWAENDLAIETRLLEYQKKGTPDAGEAIVLGLLESPAVEQPLVMETLVRGCLRAGRFEDSSSWLAGWVRAHPDDWYAHLWLGTLALHIDLPGRAAAVFDRVLQLRPHTDVRQRLGLALVSSGNDFPRALELLEDYQRANPDDPDTRIGIARCRTVLNQPDVAREILATLLAEYPHNATALEALAVVEIDLENYPAALELLRRLEPLAWDPPEDEMLQRLLRLEPTADGRSVSQRRQAAYHLLATVLRRLGRTAEADDYNRRVEQVVADSNALIAAGADAAKAPNDPGTWHKLAVLNLRVGSRTNAEFWLNKMRAADPKDPRPDRALAEYYRSRPGPASRAKADWHDNRANGVSP